MRAILMTLPLTLAGCGGTVGVEEEERLGDTYAAEIAAELPIVADPELTAALSAIGNTIVRQADPTGRAYDFHLVDSPEINAFAVPGGHIYVNRGLIARADELTELAGVLGHEIAHVTERHGLEQMEKQQQTNIFLSLLYMVMGRDPGLLEQMVIRGGAAAVFARYGRDAEREADERAVGWLVESGYDPEGMATFFEDLLAEQQRRPGTVEQWFSSHPTSDERVRNTRALIAGMEGLDRSRLLRDTPGYQAFRERVAGGRF